MQQSPIFEKTEAFLDWLLPLTSQFPKHHRFGLARRTEDRALDFYEQIVRAAKASKPNRFLYEADVQLTQLSFYLRRCHKLALLTPKQYHQGSRLVAELGRLLGGWLKKTSGV
ncbi:MAG: diversity-generating retroelement protein Avd [Chloroflexota bacterium]